MLNNTAAGINSKLFRIFVDHTLWCEVQSQLFDALWQRAQVLLNRWNDLICQALVSHAPNGDPVCMSIWCNYLAVGYLLERFVRPFAVCFLLCHHKIQSIARHLYTWVEHSVWWKTFYQKTMFFVLLIWLPLECCICTVFETVRHSAYIHQSEEIYPLSHYLQSICYSQYDQLNIVQTVAYTFVPNVLAQGVLLYRALLLIPHQASYLNKTQFITLILNNTMLQNKNYYITPGLCWWFYVRMKPFDLENAIKFTACWPFKVSGIKNVKKFSFRVLHSHFRPKLMNHLRLTDFFHIFNANDFITFLISEGFMLT